MSTLALSILPRSSKRLIAAVAACALLASTSVVAPTAAKAANAPCDAKDLAKDKKKCDPFGGDGRKN
jgi:Spy/CpxP family protein refolding chaperone